MDVMCHADHNRQPQFEDPCDNQLNRINRSLKYFITAKIHKKIRPKIAEK